MANLTITVDEEVLKRARIKALEQGTSVNSLLASKLEEYVRGDSVHERQRRAMDRLGDVAREAATDWKARRARAEPGVRRAPGKTLREEIYDERIEELARRRSRRRP